jgi:ribosomal protein L11 methyltransferase
VLEGDGTLEAGFASVEAAARVAGALAWPASVVEVDDTSWQDAWKAHAGVVEVGPIVLVPAWRTTIVIDPGTAFGSGSHPSTRLCMAALVDLVRPGVRVLDVGCGSGVLAIAAMKLGAASCVAIDVASEAVEATRANATANGVVVDARNELLDDVEGRFDVVVANIGALVLRTMAPDLVARVADGGALVLAGLLEDQVPEVVAAFGLRVERVDVEDGWAAPRLGR